MIGWMAVRYDFVDRILAEAWVELSSQRIIMTDEPCKNRMTSFKRLDTRYLYTRLARDLLSKSNRGRPKAKKYQIWFWWGMFLRRILWKTKTTRADRVRLSQTSLKKRHERTHTTQSCTYSGGSNIVQLTHRMLLSRDSAALIPSLSRSCRFHS